MVLAVALAGAGLYWKYGGAKQSGGWSMAPVKVAVAAAQQADFPVTLGGIGSLEATRQVQVAAEVDGRLARILFSPGERVRAGQLLAQLNDAPEQGELARLQAQARNARAQLERTRRLLPQQAATREQLDQAQADYDQTAADIRRVQALIEQKHIKAPFDGVLGVLRATARPIFAAGSTQPLAEWEAGAGYADAYAAVRAASALAGTRTQTVTTALPGWTGNVGLSVKVPVADVTLSEAEHTQTFTVPAGSNALRLKTTWGNPGYDLDLYVYDPRGNLIGSSANGTSTFESAWAPPLRMFIIGTGSTWAFGPPRYL